MLAAVQLVLQRGFVRPALALVRQIQAEARGLSPAPARVPPLWRPWLEAVREAFADRRAYEARLAASEERLKAAAESIPDGLAIFDAEDRFVFVNSRYPQHITPALAERLRLGVRFEDWLREGLADGPVYHPDMGEDFLERRLALHREERAEHEQELVDGRWLRLREARMRDGGRVLLTTDVTASRAQQKALAEQTRKLEAVLANIAEGVGITDPSGRVLLVNDGLLRLYGMPPRARRARHAARGLHRAPAAQRLHLPQGGRGPAARAGRAPGGALPRRRAGRLRGAGAGGPHDPGAPPAPAGRAASSRPTPTSPS